MSRDGTGTYNLPFPPVVSGTPISSTVYNGFTNDIAQDLNTARPILYGGTGASSADGALAAMGGQKAGQVVTNYDSMVWIAGSFYSAAGATSAPTANAASGIVYMADSSNIVVEARDQVTGILYLRRKVAGVWGAWSFDNVLQVAGRQTTTGGFRFTTYSLGTIASGTVTPDAYNGNYQAYNNNGAHTMAVPANECAIDIMISNMAAAGAITFSGYTVGPNTGDLMATTSGNVFIVSIRRILTVSTYVIKALQ
jgi:hypothetical protein